MFEPTWLEDSRAEFTLGVALMATHLTEPAPGRHLSISTHTGMHSSRVSGAEDLEQCADHFASLAASLAQLERDTGWRCVLSLEAEPARQLQRHGRAGPLPRTPPGVTATRTVERHLGTCLDACHAAVEFEPVGDALANATAHAAPLGKLQVTSAISLLDPADDPARPRAPLRPRRAALPAPGHWAAARPVCLRAGDLPDLQRAWAADRPDPWSECEEWRCHFHVPIDLEHLGGSGLRTTRDYADRLLAAALAHPKSWGTDELHVEIETYTWEVLPRPRPRLRRSPARDTPGRRPRGRIPPRDRPARIRRVATGVTRPSVDTPPEPL